MSLNTKGTDFNVDYVELSAPRESAQGKKIYITYNGKKLVLETPLMLTGGAIGDTMALQFSSADASADAKSTAFLNNMKAFESHLKDSAFTNTKNWFGKSHDREVVDTLFTPMLKYSKDTATGDYDLTKAPTLKVMIPNRCVIYDAYKNVLFPSADPNATPADYLKKGSKVMCQIECVGILIENGHFRVDWKLVQAGVQQPQQPLKEGMMLAAGAAFAGLVGFLAASGVE